MRKFFRIASIFLILASFIGCKPDVEVNEKTGSIQGKAFYENENVLDYSGIQVSLISTNGLMAVDYCESRGIATNARKVEDIIFTDPEGKYNFTDVPEGVYTICASSDNSTKKAVLTNVTVTAGRTVAASDLGLTATGSITGKITIDGSTDGVLGLDVFIAGTSFVAKVGSDGNYEISNIPAKKGYILCVQKEKYTTTIEDNLEVKGNDTVKIDDVNLLSKDWEEGTVEQENPTFKWLGLFETEPEDPNLYDAYFNTKDGCSYIWNGISWDLLAQAGKDGVNGDKEYDYKEILDLENFIPEKIVLKANQYSKGSRAINLDLPYVDRIPNLGDKMTLKMDFVSNKDIKGLHLRFAETSVHGNYWLELTGGEEYAYYIDEIKAGECVTIDHTFDVLEKPLQKITLNIGTGVENDFDEVELSVSKAKIEVEILSDTPNYMVIDSFEDGSTSQLTCLPTEEGIKFTGHLLSNVTGSESKCNIKIRDINNDVSMLRDYVLNESVAYESWEVIYPLVDSEKKYKFEVIVSYQNATICKKEFTVTAIGGLGEYKVENTGDYEVNLSEDKTKLSRTTQVFTDNPKVSNLILDYGTKYAIYSNNDEVTSIWDGIWRHDTVYWQSSSNQICDLTKLGWPSYDELSKTLIGRRLGTRTETHIKLAGYTHNDTAYFILNDYRETFFDWDDEETNKYFIIYRNPESNEYFTDVPGTILYYIQKEFDEDGNIVFVDVKTEGAVPVYGKLINYGDKIYEPVYAPKFEHYTFTGSWKTFVGESLYSESMKFPYNSNDIWYSGKCLPVIFEPNVEAKVYTVTVNDESGTELCKIKTNDFEFKISGSNVPLKQGYGLLYLQDSDGKQYNVNQTYECKKDLILTAKYEPLEVTFNVGDILFSDGTYIKAENVEYGIPESLKSKAMAVIINQTLEGTYLGVGIKKSDYIQWAPDGTTGYYEGFEGIKVDVTGGNWDGTSYLGYSFEGDLDGSDNWEYICSVDSSASWNAEYNYPVFNFANNYGSYAGLEGTEYENGWYVPSIAELYDVYTNKTTIQTSMDAAGGFDVESGYYWSSSQSSSYYHYAYRLYFSNGYVYDYDKYYTNDNVLVLQAFNPKQFNNYNYGTPSITSVEIPTVGEGYSGEIPVTIKGKNFIGPNFDVNNLSCAGLNLDNVTKVNDSKITATVYCDGAVGEKSFTVSYGSSSVNGILKVVEAEKCYSVGDIILTDGTKVSVSEVETYEIDETNRPIGVVAIANYNGGTAKILGLQCSDSIQWAPDGTTGYYEDFEGIKVTNYGSYYDETTGTYSGHSLEGDLDGSDNWEYICNVDSSASWDAEYNYPVFNFANNYGSYAGLEGTEYENGWYVPSIAELYDVYTNKTTIQTSMDAAGGFDVESGYYWSSSQSSSYYYYAYKLYFGNGYVNHYYKSYGDNVLVLQALNVE